MARWVLAAMFVACHTQEGAVVNLPLVDASTRDVATVPIRPPASNELEWRIVAKKLVEDPAGGMPKEMWVSVELRLGEKRIASFKFAEPDCTMGPPEPEEKIVTRIECYYAGGGDYVEVIERAPNEYDVVSYAQDESTGDDPHPPKESLRVVAKFRARGPIEARITQPDGGR